ncbi:DUF4145 domain-containing protein [Amycolatopsis sp. NPDC021455]|uniref:DUF4145 domain-containing protein n=1 Tax=Amycolatopsis sp. NPDC021455 TaxID=3154901 RepID=UPI00340F3D3A
MSIMRGATNFGHLTTIDRRLARLGASADNLVVGEPNASMVKSRQFVERMTQIIWDRTNPNVSTKPLHERITILQNKGAIDDEIGALFHSVRLEGNKAVHEFEESRFEALHLVRTCHQLGNWLMSALKLDDQPSPYTPPSPRELGYDKLDENGAYRLTDLTVPAHRPGLIFSFSGHYPPAGRSWRYTRQRLLELDNEGRIHRNPSGHLLLKRYCHETYPS